MNAFIRLQLGENTGKIFNGPKDIPTLLLTKGCLCDWLGAPLLPTPVISHTWQNYDDNAPFPTVHETGTNKFQPLLPANISKIGHNPFSPPNGTVVTTSVVTPGSTTTGTELMLMLLESTLLGTAAGTSKTGRRLVTYQMQMPTKDKETDNSKIRELSDTLEIIYEGTYDFFGFLKEPAPINITITLTWVINRCSSGVYQLLANQISPFSPSPTLNLIHERNLIGAPTAQYPH